MLEARRALITFLGGLGEQLEYYGRDCSRYSAHALAGRYRLSRDMAMYPLHRMCRGERQRASQHLIERHTKRVEVATEIDRAVHPPGLFGRHVGQRAHDELGRPGHASLPDQARSDTETGEPDPFVVEVYQYMRRFQVLVNEAALMHLV